MSIEKINLFDNQNIFFVALKDVTNSRFYKHQFPGKYFTLASKLVSTNFYA